MAKDTEKLIRQLSLVSYLMAERRPVTALEIRRDVEGYSSMNEDAFARRFYADRSELESLGIKLKVDKPSDGMSDQENYSLPPENFYLPAIDFTDQELASLQTALSLLDGEFAYAEPLRLALQQITWGRPNPLKAPAQQAIALGITGSAGGHELSQRLAKVETAIFRRKTVVFDYYSIARDQISKREVDPYQLLYTGGQFYLIGYARERESIRVFRLSRIRSKISYGTKSEHDFERPKQFDPRSYGNWVPWQLGDEQQPAKIWISSRIAWQVKRYFAQFGTITSDQDHSIFTTSYSSSRELIAWLLSLGDHARIIAPQQLKDELEQRIQLLADSHAEDIQLADPVPVDEDAPAVVTPPPRNKPPIRPERFARLVTLATLLIGAGRKQERIVASELCEQIKLTPQELEDDINLLNVVNFGGGSYVLYAELLPNGEIEVDPEPYADNFDRPARLLPVEAKALIAALDLIGAYLPQGSLQSAREKIIAALGQNTVYEGLQMRTGSESDHDHARTISEAISNSLLLGIEYYKETEDEFSRREVEPYALINGREGWYVATFDPGRDAQRHFRLDRIKSVWLSEEHFEPRPNLDPVADVDGWPRTGEVQQAQRALIWIAPQRARWAREERSVVQELQDGSILVELGFASDAWLIREVLKEAGDAVVIQPQRLRPLIAEAALALMKPAGVGSA